MKKKNLSKLVALAVLLGGVTYSSSVWATTIVIGTEGTPEPSTYSSSSYVGVDGTTNISTSVDKIFTDINVDKNTYGIKTINGYIGTAGTPATLTGGIELTNSNGNSNVWGINLDGYGIYLSSVGNVKVKGGSRAFGLQLAGKHTAKINFSSGSSITAVAIGEAAESAFGMIFNNENTLSEDATLSVDMNAGSIMVYCGVGESYGIFFDEGATGTSEVKNVNKITVGIDPYDSETISSGTVYGIQAIAGTNTVTFTGAGSSITAKSTGENAYGIMYGRISAGLERATGTTTISGLGSITAETTYTTDNTKSAYGIYVQNGNTENTKKFSVAFDEIDGGSITVYSAKGGNCGIHIDGDDGINEITNVKSIKVGEKSGSADNSNAAFGITATNGTNNIVFKENGTITVKSTGVTAAGIYLASGTTTISNLGGTMDGITVSGGNTTNCMKIGMQGGTLNLKKSTIKATDDVTTVACVGAGNMNLSEGTKVYGPVNVYEGSSLTVGVEDSTSEWHINKFDGTGAINVTNNGKFFVEDKLDLSGTTSSITSNSGSGIYFVTPSTFTKGTSGDTMMKLNTNISIGSGVGVYVNTSALSDLVVGDVITLMDVGSNTITLDGSAVLQVWNGSSYVDTSNITLSGTSKLIYTVEEFTPPTPPTGKIIEIQTDGKSQIGGTASTYYSGTDYVGADGKVNLDAAIDQIKTVDAGVASNVYGIKVDGTKSITVTSLKDGISVKSTSGNAYGISLAGTGTSNIAGLGSITAGTSATTSDKNAIGIFAAGDNGSSLNVTFAGTEKTITALSDSKYGEGIVIGGGGNTTILDLKKIIAKGAVGSYGLELAGGTNYIGTDSTGATGKELATIEVGFVGDNISSGEAIGISTKMSGTSTIAFGTNSSITAKSTGKNVYGIAMYNDVTVSGLGKIVVGTTSTTADAKDAYGIFASFGTNIVSFKGSSETPTQAITATSANGNAYSIYTEDGGSTTVNFEDSILSGKVYQNGDATLTLNFNNGGVWTPKTDDVTGTVTVKVNDGGKVRFDEAATVNSIITNSTGTVEVNAKDVFVTSIKGSNGVETYAFDLTGLTADETMLNITSTTDSLDLGTDDVLRVTTGDFAENGVITLIKETAGTFNLTGLKFEVDGTVIDDTEVGEFFKLANNDKSITFTNVVLDVDIKPVNKTSGNIVTVTGDRTATVEGETIKTPKEGRNWKDVYGGYAKTGDSNNNEVNIENGLIKGNVYGGYVEAGDVTGNTINITGGEIAGNVYAGKSDETGATVTGNTINWSAGTIKGSEITANIINITGTDAKYLGTTGVMAADEAVNLAGTLTVGNGTEASVLTVDKGIVTGENAILQVQKDSQVITKGTTVITGSVKGSGKLVNQGEMTIYSDTAVVESTVDNTAGTLEIAGTTWTGAVAVGGTVNLKLEDYSNITNYDAKGGNINIASGLITAADIADTVAAGTKLNLTETATYKTLSENVFDAAGNLKGNVAFVAGTLELTDATYSVSSLKSVQGKLGENTQLKMDGKPDSGEVITTKIMSDLGQKVVLPTVTVKAEEKNTLIGTNTGATVEVVGVGVMNDKQAEGFNVDKLDLKAGSTGLVITNDKKVALGGNADTTGKGNLVTVDGKAEQVNIVVGLPKTIEGTTETKGTLAIGIKGSTNENGYVLKGNITANKDSEVEVNADTEITGKVELKEEAKFVAADNVKVVMSDLDLDDSSMTVGEGSVVETATLTAGSTQEKGLESSITGKVDVKDTFVIDKSSKEGETAKTVTILVGNEEGKGVVLAKKIELGGNIIFVDPAWAPGVGVEGASQVATETTALDGTYIAGQNAILTFGTTDEQKAVTDFAATGLNWSESDVTAMAYILKPIDVSNGALIVDGSMTKKPAEVSANGTVTFADQSLLMVDGIICHDTAAISGIKTLTVADTSKLYIANGVAGGQYKILAGNVENGWSNKDNILSNATVKVEDIVIDKESGVYTITLGKSEYKFADTKIPNVATAMNEAAVDTAAQKYMQTALDYGTLVSHQGMVDSINALGNMGAIAGVNHSQFTIANLAEDSVNRHLDIQNNKVGKEIWAEVIHTKEDVNGLGGTDVNYKGQYNGTIVGADLVKNDKFVFGAALSHVKGDNNGNFSSKNETKHTGVTLYGRSMLPNDAAITYDISFMHGTNDMRMTTLAVADTRITGDQTVNSFSVGTRFEQKVQVGKNTSIQPYVGARWLRMKNGSFTNSLGMNYDSASSNTVIVPLGLSFKAGVENGGWKMALTGDLGYQWNLGNKDITTNLSYNNGCNAVDATFADANDWYVGVGLEFAKKNFTASVGTRYVKGSSTKQNRWFANLAWSF